METANRIDTVYAILSGDDSSDRGCKAIPEEACIQVPRNYLLNVLNGSCTKLAEQLAGPNLVLPWLLSVIGAPAALTGFLMPVKQTGSLLPQMAVSGRIRQYSRRKWFWTGAGITQAVLLLLMIPAVLLLPPLGAGFAVLGLLALFSVASGVGSVAFQDVAGKTIPKGRRGRLLANRATIGGLLTIAAGIVLKFWIGRSGDIRIYVFLLLIAAGLWLLGAFFFANIKEQPGATENGKNALREARTGFRYFREKRGYRRYLAARMALLTIEIATPFYVLHARELPGNKIGSFAVFVIAVGAAKVLSSPFWGKFADASSRRVMIAAGFLGAFAGILAILISLFYSAIGSASLYALVFLAVGFAEGGVRMGRKTFLIDATEAQTRATYVAFGNTFIGLLTLLSGLLGFIAQILGTDALIITLTALALLGSLLSYRMPEADNMLKESG